MNVLILGFSVLNHLTDRFSETRDGVTYSIRALGGNHFDLLPFIIENLLLEDKPDLVILDLVSTPRAARWTPQMFGDATRFLVYKCRQHGSKVAFANLYRMEIDQGKDVLHGTVHAIAAEIVAPVLDMLVLHEKQGHNLRQLYPDGNHPSAQGRVILGDALEAFSRRCGAKQSSCGLPQRYAQRMPVSLAFDVTEGMFTRFGFHAAVKHLHPGMPETLQLPANFNLSGLLLIMGPKTGRILVSYADVAHESMIYDRFCYYERLKHIDLPERPAVSVCVEQMPEIPDIPLQKGTPDTLPRLGGVVTCLGYLNLEKI